MPVLLQPRRPPGWKILVPALVILALMAWSIHRGRQQAATGRAAAEVVEITGETQGTYFTVKFVPPTGWTGRVDTVGRALQECFAGIERQMSAYVPDSEISAFNRSTSTAPFAVSAAFAEVVRFGLTLSEKSSGVFDMTVGPLVNLWGFGPADTRGDTPADEDTAAARARVGWTNLSVTADGRLRKARPDLVLDVNAVAQGFTVDAASRVLSGFGLTDHMVEVGGEVFASGLNGARQRWRIGVDRPRPDAWPGEELQGVLSVSGFAVSTSGDYRHYREDAKGATLSHIIDPRTGQPVRRPQCSVTVVAPDCLAADGLATALSAMGPEAGLAWLPAAWPTAEAMFIVRTPNGRFAERFTPGFRARTGYHAME